MPFVFHFIWLERNYRVFNKTTKLEERLLDEIMAELDKWKTVGFSCEIIVLFSLPWLSNSVCVVHSFPYLS